eukprot:718396-Pleurochrysis_carterae.AAC.3
MDGWIDREAGRGRRSGRNWELKGKQWDRNVCVCVGEKESTRKCSGTRAPGRAIRARLHVVVANDALHEEEAVPARQEDQKGTHELEPHGDFNLRITSSGKWSSMMSRSRQMR